jgi:hypothetical protein
MTAVRKLLMPQHVFDRLLSSVFETPDELETGVRLFGTTVGANPHFAPKSGSGNGVPTSYADVVLAIAGPGIRATHEPAHYSGDENHSSEVFDALRCALRGIAWLGELHVHPRGMTWLSPGDRQTVRQILTGKDNTLHPEEFIAGVMQRRNKSVDIYPWHFSRDCLEGRAMAFAIVESDAPVVKQATQKGMEHGRPRICAKPERSTTAPEQAPWRRWLRQWRQRLGRYGRALRHRHVHFGRSRNARA